MHTMTDEALRWILNAEGGYVNDPKDPGGETNKGITVGALQAAHRQGLTTTTSVRSLTDDDVRVIYGHNYWSPSCAGCCIPPLDLILFDMAVNSGPVTAQMHLARAAGLKGCSLPIGPHEDNVWDHFNAMMEGNALAIACMNERLAFYKALVTWRTFGHGWTNRLINLAAHCGIDWKP